MPEIIYSVWESGWEESTLHGLYKTKENAIKNLHMIAAEENRKQAEILDVRNESDKQSEGSKALIKWNKKMMKDRLFTFNPVTELYTSKFSSIGVSEQTLND